MAELALRKEVVSRRLSELRDEHGLSQERAAGRVGVTVRQWQRWESGSSVPYPRNFDAIAEAFGISVAEFFDGREDGTPERPGSQLDRIEAKVDNLAASLNTLITTLAGGLDGATQPSEENLAQVVQLFRDAAVQAHAQREAETPESVRPAGA